MGNSFDLIIFDCDGTLVDSEPVNDLSFTQALAESGFPEYTAETAAEHFRGLSMKDIVKIIEKETGRKMPGEIRQRYIDRVAINSVSGLRPAPGAVETLEAVRGRYKICVASNGEITNVRNSLNRTGQAQYFNPDAVFTAAMVERPKPAPDLFLYAAKMMNASPEKSLVIEDSTAGARAGISAGMTVFGFTGVCPDPATQKKRLLEIGVKEVLNDMRELVELL